MNKVIMVGRLVRDVECRNVGTNGRVCNNVVAVSRYHKDNKGERQVDFIPIVAWNHSADLLKKYSKKGDQISISGRMQSRKYTNKEEQEVYVIECLVDDITFIYQGYNSRSQGQTQSQNQSQGQSQSQGQNQNQDQNQSQGQTQSQGQNQSDSQNHNQSQGQTQSQDQAINKEEVPVSTSQEALA